MPRPRHGPVERAVARRIERLPDAAASDRDKLRGIEDLEREYEARLASGRPPLDELPWLLEELRVAHFAQALGARGQVSAKRIRKQIRDAAP